MTLHVCIRLCLAIASIVPIAAHAASGPASAKRAVRDANDLPAYSYVLPSAPSQLLTGPVDPVLALADELARDDATTLEAYDIRDLATREAIVGRALSAALLRRDLAKVREHAAALRAMQEREDRRLTAGLITEIAAEACVSSDPGATATALARARLARLPYGEVDTWFKSQLAAMSTANPDLVVGAFRQQIDPIAVANGGRVDQAVADAIVANRAQLECRLPVASQLAAVLTSIIEANASATPLADIWPARQVVLEEAMRGTPVTVAIWDSGVDMSLFDAAADPGFAIDGEGRPMPDALLRPADEYAPRLAELMDLIKGAMDLQAGQATSDAARFQQTMQGLKAEQAKDFSEAMGFVGNYVHGTHVAGIAVAGNPFARVQAVSMHWPHQQERLRLDRAISERRAAFYRDAVARMRKAGVRVVNMSWRIGPAAFEQILQVQGDMPDAAQRKRVATELFAIEKAALEAAIRSAPEILFVAGAGNESNDASFADYIPAGLQAPNLLTVGAVDRAGREASFTSTGGSVALHANGVEVESVFPGGQRRALSGTSMASPQVANTAAKLIAMKPSLSGAELRALLVETAEPRDRVRLLDPKATFARAGIQL